MKTKDLIIIGGGSAGMSAALGAKEAGVKDILILERGEELGGILQQCIHNGFGLQLFHEEMSGPAYAQRFQQMIVEEAIDYRLQTTVLEVTKDRKVLYVNEEEGYVWVQAKAIVFASGCYERNRGAIHIPGKRLPGVYTAGSAQRFLNIENIRVGNNVFILGSGDIGLIMARRMTLEGAKVIGVAELMSYSNGLTRNLVQCLQDYDIPLYLSHTIVHIEGNQHVEAVILAKVDEQGQVIAGSEQRIEVDTLLLSVGLIPENDLGERIGMEMDHKTKGAKVNEFYETSIPHIYACGNALHVHDIVDFVSMESKEAGICAAHDLLFHKQGNRTIQTIAGNGISYVLPQVLSDEITKDLTLSFRCKRPYQHCMIQIKDEKHILKEIKKAVLLPAEMQRIQMNKDDVASLQGSLYVEVKPL